jgi:hypothetical protein
MVHAERANCAIAAAADKPSACQGECQESRWSSSALLAPWGAGQTLTISVSSSHAALLKGTPCSRIAFLSISLFPPDNSISTFDVSMFEYANSSELTVYRPGVESIVSSALMQGIVEQVSQSHTSFF